MVVYVNSERTHFGFILNQKCYQDFNETILETLSMSEKALTLYRIGFFGAVHGWGEGGRQKGPPFPKTCLKYPAMMELLNLVQLYLTQRKSKKYMRHV